MRSSKDIFDAYEQRSWRSVAQRQRARGMEYVAGKREGSYVWDSEGKRRLLDCSTSGGVHALGHRHPEIVAVNNYFNTILHYWCSVRRYSSVRHFSSHRPSILN